MRIKNGILYEVRDEDLNADGSFIVPNSVTSIKSYAFLYCSKLLSVIIPDSVKRIGEAAFEGCTNLTSVTIPNSVMSIEDRAFSHCFKLTSTIIPNGVKTIGDYAFSNCENLSSVIIPDSVTNIGYCAFQNCIRLTSVTLGNSVEDIGDYAFAYCFALTSVTIPNSVKRIGEWAFFDCVGLTSKRANYKAFALTKRGGLLCRDKTYAVGEKSMVEGNLEICKNGIHYCTNIFDIFTYYYGEYGKDFVIGICEVSDENTGVVRDSKRCARWIEPTKILTREEVIKIMDGGCPSV